MEFQETEQWYTQGLNNDNTHSKDKMKTKSGAVRKHI